MSLLESMLGRIGGDAKGPCKFRSDRYDVTFTVSTESHDVAYAIAVSEAELAAFAELLRVERETPYVAEGDESLTEALESVLESETIDAETWTERMEAPRRAVEPIVETWRELVAVDAGGGNRDDEDGRGSDVHVVYLPAGLESVIAEFFGLCRDRNEREFDPFELPEDVEVAAAVLSRTRAATDRAENRVVVNTRHLPL